MQGGGPYPWLRSGVLVVCFVQYHTVKGESTQRFALTLSNPIAALAWSPVRAGEMRRSGVAN